MSGNLYSTWTTDELRQAIRDAEELLASNAANVSSADGTSTTFRAAERIEVTIERMQLALQDAENGGRRPRIRRLNFMRHGRFRRFMR